MAAARRLKRVAASQPGFLSLKSSTQPADLLSSRRKRVSKNKKKNWNKHSDIHDVEEFLEDVRLQERTTGGLLSEKSDDTLFFLDVGEQRNTAAKAAEPVEGKEKKKGKQSRPLRIDLILQSDSLVPPPKDVLAYQQPNAKKLRRIAEKAERLAAKAVVTQRHKRLLNRRSVIRPTKTAVTDANNNPDRDYYDIWQQESKDVGDSWYLQQTGKKLVKRPEKLNEKPSVLPAVEVIAPGGSYNPDFFSHQALLQEAHEVEVKKKKEEEKVERQLAFNKDDAATEETVFQEQVEGLVEEEENEEENTVDQQAEDVPVGAIAQAEKKSEKQRKKQKAEKIKEQQQLAIKRQIEKRQQLFQLRSIKASIKEKEQITMKRREQRKAKQEAQKSQPRRLGRLKFQAQDLEVQLSDELANSLLRLKPEGSVVKDRFKSMQKRNLIEPRERAKFKRRHKLKYVEKRAFRQIT
ncbi:ribosome biogenesis protein NOP53 [Thalassophryne amazonica]|uniref:ribosome biogenesis protein NOP53 n=1 Tax=Thalassophryne amazonica TaxID=390379 RepID=UPI001470EBE4|nr:ribosome biogenesis protein NOP53 [Thalassophryne amazonica]